MRVALLEMLHPDAAPADTPIPPEGAIDEAVELAKTYSGADAPEVRQRHPRRRPSRDGRQSRHDAMSEADDHPRRARRPARARRRAAALGRPQRRRRRDRRRGLRGARLAGLGRARAPRPRGRARAAAGPGHAPLTARADAQRRRGRTPRSCSCSSSTSSSALRFSGRARHRRLVEAMRYSLLAGGKRIRPVLALATARAIGRDERDVLPLAAAHRAHPHVLAHPRRPAGDGRRRHAPRPPDRATSPSARTSRSSPATASTPRRSATSSRHQRGEPRAILAAMARARGRDRRRRHGRRPVHGRRRRAAATPTTCAACTS